MKKRCVTITIVNLLSDFGLKCYFTRDKGSYHFAKHIIKFCITSDINGDNFINKNKYYYKGKILETKIMYQSKWLNAKNNDKFYALNRNVNVYAVN